MTNPISYEAMLRVAIEEARLGLSEGGIPIGAALRPVMIGDGQRLSGSMPGCVAQLEPFNAASRSSLGRRESSDTRR